MTTQLRRAAALLLAVFSITWSSTAFAAVQIHFHSFNGSVLFGRYPHTFIVLEGTLDANGAVIKENYGFSARKATMAVLNGPVEHMVLVETDKNIRKTNRHFSMTITDAQYRRIINEVKKWQNAPGKYYDLETRNCIHFVGKMGQILGLKIDYPQNMLRRPKKWLNHVTRLNPQLGAKKI